MIASKGGMKMGKIIFLLLVIASAHAMASTPRIDVKTELSVNGRVIPRDRIKMKVKTKPTSEKMDEIIVDMDMEYKVGENIIRSTPQVYAKAGSEATMTLEESTKEDKIVLKVLAKARED